MRIKMFINCPKCLHVFMFKLNILSNGQYKNTPSFECSCGCKVDFKIDIGTSVKK